MTPLAAALFDADGVLLDSPHERAWREALEGLADPARFTSALYQREVAGKPRLDGARAALAALGVPVDRAEDYAARKQKLIEKLIAEGAFAAWPDAVALARALDAAGVKLAVASSSHNAAAMLRRLDLSALFAADLSGHAPARGKPAPDIFLAAAAALAAPPPSCVVVEDAPSGIAAARAGGMKALGIARTQADVKLLEEAGAHLVVRDLGHVDVPALVEGTLRAAGKQASPSFS
jgi:HAD superfamily hydrolase (TIGR01509 family)